MFDNEKRTILQSLKTINKKTADKNMKNIRTPKMIAIAACLMAATAYTAHAGFTSETWMSVTPGPSIIVDYQLTGPVAGVYTYEYKIFNTSLGSIFGVTIDDGVPAGAVTVSSPAGVTGAAATGSVTWLFATPAGGLDPLPPDHTSGILKLTTTDKPGSFGGSVFDESSGPWIPATPGQDVLAPVPEPTTLIAGALLLLPFGASTLRILRKSRMV